MTVRFYQFDGALQASDARMDERAFGYGDGFFSTIGVHDGQMLWADGHRARVIAGLGALEMVLDVDGLMAQLHTLAAAITEGIIKIIITRAPQSVRGYGYRGGDSRATAYIKCQAMPVYQAHQWQDGLPIVMPVDMICLDSQIAHRPPRLAGLKLIACPDQVLAHAELLARQEQAGATDGLVANVHGQYICATMGNVFYQIDGAWYTPPVNLSGVAGVMRAQVLTSDYFGHISERVLMQGDLSAIQAMFITNAVRGIIPVRRLDGWVLDQFV